MWLILGDNNDHSAVWLYQQLQRRGLYDVQLVSSSAVAYNLYWNHRMTHDSGEEFVLSNGHRFRTDGISGVFNRLPAIPADRMHSAFLSDRRHAEHEQMAYFLHWLYSLPVPVINRPKMQAFTGGWRRASEWAILAAIVGLRPAPFCESAATSGDELAPGKIVPFEMPTQTVYVVGEKVIGADVPRRVAESCINLARMANCELLGIDFTAGSASWLVMGVNAYPDLRPGGGALADCIYKVMTRPQPPMALNVRSRTCSAVKLRAT